MLWSLAMFAPLSLIASDLPRWLAWPMALLAGLHGMVVARRHARQPSHRLLIPAGAGDASCDGGCMHGLELDWRGPLAFLRWRDAAGATRRLSLWPDTLDAGMRRELRIAMQRREAASDGASMAG